MKNHDNIVEDSNYMVFSAIKLDTPADHKNFNSVLKHCISEVNRTANKITKIESKSSSYKSKVTSEALAKISPWFYKVLKGGISKLVNKGISSRSKKKEVNYDIHKVKKSLAFCKTLSTSPELRGSKRKIKIPKFNLNSESRVIPSRKDSDDFFSLTPEKSKIFPFTSRYHNDKDKYDNKSERDSPLKMKKNENNYYVTNGKEARKYAVRNSVALPTGITMKFPSVMKSNLMRKSDLVIDDNISMKDKAKISENFENAVKKENTTGNTDRDNTNTSENSLIHLEKLEIDPNDQTNRSRALPVSENQDKYKTPKIHRMGTMININKFSEKFISMKSLDILDEIHNPKGSRNSKMYNITSGPEVNGQENEDTKLTELAYLDTSHRSRGSNTGYNGTNSNLANNHTEDTSLTSRSNYKMNTQANENYDYKNNLNDHSTNKGTGATKVSFLDVKDKNKNFSKFHSPVKLRGGNKLILSNNSNNVNVNNGNIGNINTQSPSPSQSPSTYLPSPETVGIKNVNNTHSRNYLNIASTTATTSPSKMHLHTHKSSLLSKLLTSQNTTMLPSNIKFSSKEKKENFNSNFISNSNNPSNNHSQSNFMMSKTGVLPKFNKTHLNNNTPNNQNKTHLNFHSTTTESHLLTTNPRFHLPNQNKFQKTFDDIIKEKSLIEDKIKKHNFLLPDKKNEIDKTESSIRALLGSDFAPKMLDGVLSYTTGITSYIEKTRADMLKCADTFSRMNPLAVVRMGGKFVSRYEEFSKAAEVDEFADREYRPFNLDRLGRNQMIMKKISRSISDSQKKMLKNRKDKY
jgi:hypothetical protein